MFDSLAAVNQIPSWDLWAKGQLVRVGNTAGAQGEAANGMLTFDRGSSVFVGNRETVRAAQLWWVWQTGHEVRHCLSHEHNHAVAAQGKSTVSATTGSEGKGRTHRLYRCTSCPRRLAGEMR